MPHDNLLPTLVAIMEDTFGRDDLVITEQTTAHDIPEWDSISHIRLILAIEMRFNVKFSSIELTGFENVGALVESLRGKLKGC